ncbi:hypothetical protein [Xylanibacter ruminicola]|jgi:tetratricopeptide (TPR) repeat protein|uniref:Uncharacterized protein n=1 Tax=Xylanibacter ruminicola TaxID=839 RepID=A0A1M6RM49_XYLRU|nr:hypothetical protein [Xylanibacter ruminicola]SHK33428.1 hypothetical protein SAMN05216463_10219 [Xylanibacter ruminicola]
MDIINILKKAEKLTSDQEKLEYLGQYIGEHLDKLSPKEFVLLLTPLVDISYRLYQQSPSLEALGDYTVAITKLAEYLIADDQGWKAKPLLEKTQQLLNEQPDIEAYQQWRYDTWLQMGQCYYNNQRRQQAKQAFQQALAIAASAGIDADDCHYFLDKIENPMLKYDPVEDSKEYLEVIDEVEQKLYEQLKDEPRFMGFCFRYWAAKRDILAEYGIQWRSPGTMNPRVIFD